MEELYSKASEIKRSYCHIATLRGGPQLLYREGGHHHNPNAMDIDHLMLSPVECTCHIYKNYCFIRYKKGYSTRNHPGYNCGHPAGIWHTNLKPSQTAHARIVFSTPHLASTPSHQDDPLDLCHQNSRT